MTDNQMIRNFMLATGLDPDDAEAFKVLTDVMHRASTEPPPDFDEHHISQIDDNTGQVVLNFDPRAM